MHTRARKGYLMNDSQLRPALMEVGGMTCDDCAHHVTQALLAAGAGDVSVQWRTGKARFSWPVGVSESALSAAVAGAGYRPGQLQVVKAAEPLYRPGAGSDYDLVILGAGSAAFAAAIKATEAGFKVAMVEESTLGGTCVNVGCVPSKALLRAGELAWTAGHHPFAGISTTSGPVDLQKLVGQKDELVAMLRQVKYADLVSDYGFTLIPGHAHFTSPSAIIVDGKTIAAGTFLIATGASPSAPPIPGLSESGYLTSTSALDQTRVPQRLAVIGANAIGLELGQFFLHVGSQVTFIDVAERIAPFEEPEISAALQRVLVSQGAQVYTSASVLSVHRSGAEVVVELEANGEKAHVVAEEVLVATGRRPNTAKLSVDLAGVELDGRGAVVVDSELRTTNPRVFAAGDVTGAPQFVYVSAYEGALAVDNSLLGLGRPVDLSGLPRVTFTMPQVASAGLSEAEARLGGHEVQVSILPLRAVPRALVNHDTSGLVKLVAESGTGRLLGASMLAEGAGDVIQAVVIAIRHGITVGELAGTFHPYLTMAEALKLASQTFSRDVSKLSCCAA